MFFGSEIPLPLYFPVLLLGTRSLEIEALSTALKGLDVLEGRAIRDSASPNPKMHQKLKTIEIEMYCGSKYNTTVGTWSLTLVRLVNFIIFSGKGKS